MANSTVQIKAQSPGPFEQKRQWGETFQEMENFYTIIIENRKGFLPGEDVEDYYTAWNEMGDPFQAVRTQFPHLINDDPESGTITDEDFNRSGLGNEQGKLKRNSFRRKLDDFKRLWHQPKEVISWRGLSLAAQDCAEAAETILQSVPGVGTAVLEFAGFVKLGLTINHRRRYEES